MCLLHKNIFLYHNNLLTLNLDLIEKVAILRTAHNKGQGRVNKCDEN